MALNTNTTLVNNADGYVANATDIKGGYFVTSDISSIPSYLNVEGALCYCTETNKFYKYNTTSWAETLERELPSLSSNAGKILAVNSNSDGVEWVNNIKLRFEGGILYITNDGTNP